MKSTIFAMLTVIITLTTACSPKHEELSSNVSGKQRATFKSRHAHVQPLCPKENLSNMELYNGPIQSQNVTITKATTSSIETKPNQNTPEKIVTETVYLPTSVTIKPVKSNRGLVLSSRVFNKQNCKDITPVLSESTEVFGISVDKKWLEYQPFKYLIPQNTVTIEVSLTGEGNSTKVNPGLNLIQYYFYSLTCPEGPKTVSDISGCKEELFETGTLFLNVQIQDN